MLVQSGAVHLVHWTTAHAPAESEPASACTHSCCHHHESPDTETPETPETPDAEHESSCSICLALATALLSTDDTTTVLPWHYRGTPVALAAPLSPDTRSLRSHPARGPPRRG